MKVLFIRFKIKKKKKKEKDGSIHKNRKCLSRDRKNYVFAQKCILVTK